MHLCLCVRERVWDSFMYDTFDFDYYYLTWIMCAYGTAGEIEEKVEKKRTQPLWVKQQHQQLILERPKEQEGIAE